MATATALTAIGNDADLSSYPYTVAVPGSGGAGRTLFFFLGVRCSASGNVVLNTATVDGIPATIVDQVNISDGNGGTVSDCIALVKIKASLLPTPTATSVSVIGNFSAACSRGAVLPFVTADDIAATHFGLVKATDPVGGGATAALTFPSLNIPANGFAIGGVFVGDVSSGGTWAWTNLPVDQESGIENCSYSSAHINVTSAESRSISANIASGTVNLFSAVGIVASFAPAGAAQRCQVVIIG